MPTIQKLSKKPFVVGFTLGQALILTFGGCASTRELVELRAEVGQLQELLLEIRDETASKQQVEELSSSIARQNERSSGAQSEAQAGIDRLSDELASLRTQFQLGVSELDKLSETIATAQVEIELLRSLLLDLISNPATPTLELSSDPDELYQSSLSAFKADNYDDALLGFRRFLDSFANSEQADDALYWIGECYFSQNKFRRAIESFDQLPTRYPNSDRRPTALWRKGVAHIQLGELERGRSIYQDVIDNFPRSDEAAIARNQIEGQGG